MTILFKIVDWNSGSVAGSFPITFTASTPNYPVNHEVKGEWAGRTQSNGSPWNGLYLLDCTGAWYYGAYFDTTSATAQATSGRILLQATPNSDTADYNVFSLGVAADENDFRVGVRRDTTNISISMLWDNENQAASVSFTFPTVPYNVEVIYNTNAGTSADRLKARIWDVGASAGSFTNTADSSTAFTSNQPTRFSIGSYSNSETYAKYGRVFISDDTSEDLSTQLNDAVNFNPFFMFNI